MTAGVVLARLTLPNMLSFFTPEEVGVAQPMLDLLLAQDCEPRVPVLPLIDSRLATGETDGWHYDDLPEDGQAWRDTLAHLDEDARERHGVGYAELTVQSRLACCETWPRPRGGRRFLARVPRQPRLEPVDAVRQHRVLLSSLGVERDRFRRAGLSAWLPQPGNQRPRKNWRPRPWRRRPGSVRQARGAGP